jgi:hypothetical protein
VGDRRTPGWSAQPSPSRRDPDIAIDAYAVDVLRPDEQGAVVGARIAIYRGAMFVAGSLAITLAGRYSWPLVCTGLAVAYLPMLLVTALAPEPERMPAAPASLRDAIWLPIVGVLARHRALEILAFVVFTSSPTIWRRASPAPSSSISATTTSPAAWPSARWP